LLTTSMTDAAGYLLVLGLTSAALIVGLG